MDNHKATPEQWAALQACTAAHPGAWGDCILELRSRVMALEAQAGNYPVIPDSSTPPPMATDEELRGLWTAKKEFLAALRVLHNLGVAHGQAGSREVAEPVPIAGGLVERISYEIRIGRTTLKSDEVTAVHTILEVARWLRSELVSREIAERLEQEAGR